MRIGIGLPAAVSGWPATDIARWSIDAERLGFRSVAVIDRLVYDCLEPLVALGAAAAVTKDIELFTTVLCVGWRANPVLLAKQLAAVHQISAGRLTAGLGLGHWQDDYTFSAVPMAGRGKEFDRTLETLHRVWSGQLTGELATISALPDGGPRLMIGGFTPPAYARVARSGAGWLAPGFGMALLHEGMAAVQAEWTAAGRTGTPRVLVERYFALGPDADADTDRYLRRYWNGTEEYLDAMSADLLTDEDHLKSEITELARAGCDDLVLLPCAGSPDQVGLLAAALERIGARGPAGFEVVA